MEDRLKNAPDWENPQIFEINKEKAHFFAHAFDSVESALEGTNPIGEMSLNGLWKFNIADCPEHRPVDFFKTDYDASSWADIKVPSVWETQGYG